MSLTTGRTKALEGAMNNIAIIERVRGSMLAMVQLIARAIEIDAKDDPLLQQADDQLRAYATFDDKTVRDACVYRAHASIHAAKEIDFNDMSLPALLAMVQELQKSLEASLTEQRAVVQQLTAPRRRGKKEAA